MRLCSRDAITVGWPILDDFQGWGFRPVSSYALEFLDPLRSDQAFDARQNPHPSKAEGWGTRNCKTVGNVRATRHICFLNPREDRI